MSPSNATPTFVLIPGASATSFMWTPLVRELALRGHRALPIELPGHGFDNVFPAGYQCPQDTERLATAPSPVAALTLDDYVAHTLQIVRRVAVHGPVVLVGHSMGGSTVTGVANTAPELLARLVYLCAYCCVALPSVPAYAPTPHTADSLHTHARQVVWIGPDESLQAVLADAQVNPATWAQLPRTSIRTTHDRVLPAAVQDRMIAEADALAPTNPFDVHSLNTSPQVRDHRHRFPWRSGDR